MRDLQAGRLDSATPLLKSCIAQNPAHAEAFIHLGEVHRQAGRLDEALSLCDKGLALQPTSAKGRLIRGIIRRDRGHLDGAIEDLRIAAPQFPNVAAIHALLGFVLSYRDQNSEAIAVLRQAVALDPSVADVHKTLGDLYQAMGQTRDAFDSYRLAVQIRPDYALAYGNLGRVLLSLGDLPLAASMCETALRIQPDLVDVLCYLGTIRRLQGEADAATDVYRRALVQRPDHVEARTELCALRRQACDWAGLDADDEAVRSGSFRSGKRVTPFAILTGPSSPAEMLQCARLWAQSMEPADGRKLAIYAPRAPADRTRRLRIGYLSADYRIHATATLIAELFERHDRQRFELFGYSLGPDDGSTMRRRLISSFDWFIDLRGLGHAEAAQRIKADGIDILVDLKGYTGDAKTEIVAYRPAPIQVNYLGYPGTMGAPFVDYIIADAIVAPLAHQPFYDEKIVHLPHCYQPNDRQRAVAETIPSRAACRLPDDGFVFCCFNSTYKITPDVFDIWMRLLRETPGAVLWLLDSAATANLMREAKARGVSENRLIFAPTLPLADHLARLSLADLFLDTLPVNAHTTASEALWVGVPVLTCLGDAFVGRVAGSLLEAIGLPELVTTTAEAYEALALRLARDPIELSRFRERLRKNRLTAPLFDTARYVRSYETALLQMVALQDSGKPPEAFAIPPLEV